MEYAYNATTNRSAKKVNGTWVEWYLNDGNHTVVDFDGGARGFGPGEAVRRYVYGPGVDERIVPLIDAAHQLPGWA